MAAREEDLIHLQDRADGTDRRRKGRQVHPCKGCFYHGGKTEYVKSCNYYLITGNRRPCDAGENCTVRRDGSRGRRNPLENKNF